MRPKMSETKFLTQPRISQLKQGLYGSSTLASGLKTSSCLTERALWVLCDSVARTLPARKSISCLVLTRGFNVIWLCSKLPQLLHVKSSKKCMRSCIWVRQHHSLRKPSISPMPSLATWRIIHCPEMLYWASHRRIPVLSGALVRQSLSVPREGSLLTSPRSQAARYSVRLSCSS